MRIPRKGGSSTLSSSSSCARAAACSSRRAAASLGVARPTVASHLAALEATGAITLVRPFRAGGGRELTRTPRIHGFDTGFVAFARGWHPLRPDDFGILWEHVAVGT